MKQGARLSEKLTLSLLLFSVASFILLNSLTPAVSSAQSSRSVFVFLFRIFGFLPFFTHAFVRKAAHFAEYALLGILAFLAPRVFGKGKRSQYFMLLPLGLLVAALDELLQIIPPGRVPLLTDALIDFGGFVFGMLLSFLFRLCKEKRRLV